VIERAGDVIPYVVKSLPDLRDGSEQEVIFPSTCPMDSSDTVLLAREEGEAAWRCNNCICGKQDIQRIIYHVSKDGMDIDGCGPSYIEKFYALGWIKDISDVYALDYNAISDLEGFGHKSSEKLKKAVDKAKKNSLTRVLQSLSIHHLGKRASKLIAAEISDVFELSEWTEERFLEIKDIGPVVALNVSKYFADPQNIALLQRMKDRGVNLSQTEADKPIVVAKDAVLNEKSILFTGTLGTMSRNEAKKIATSLGARCISAVSNQLDILVVGEKAGSKLKKAEAIGTIKIMSEEEFIALTSSS